MRTESITPSSATASRSLWAIFSRAYAPNRSIYARFATLDTDQPHGVSMRSRDQRLDVDVQLTEEWQSSLFDSLQSASDFTRAGRIGWSRGHDQRTLEPVALTASEWSMQSAEVREIRSTFFESMPTGVATLDGALVMRDLPLTMTAVR